MENYDAWKLDTPENYEILNFTCLMCEDLQDIMGSIDPDLELCDDCYTAFHEDDFVYEE